MKMISVYNAVGDEVRISSDMLEYFANAGFFPVQEEAIVEDEVIEESE